MKITYIRHSGFLLENDKLAIMIDCCGIKQNRALFPDFSGRRLYLLASHVHGDHFDPAIMTFGSGERVWVLSEDIRGELPARKNEAIHFIKKGGVYKDELLTVKAYGSTDEGVSFYIETGGLKVFHAGDLNNWHWEEEETPEDAAKNEKFFLDELALITRDIKTLDAAMFPVDPRLGKDYARGAEQFLDSIKVRLFAPMHFWDNYEAARAFRPKAEARGCTFADIRKSWDVFELNNGGC